MWWTRQEELYRNKYKCVYTPQRTGREARGGGSESRHESRNQRGSEERSEAEGAGTSKHPHRRRQIRGATARTKDASARLTAQCCGWAHLRAPLVPHAPGCGHALACGWSLTPAALGRLRACRRSPLLWCVFYSVRQSLLAARFV